ncbi:DEAD/DEAH box helicase [Actinomyces vulturis]|uniref:DEAD/DEAH box helicase n=1 Tax=Actinomyces vulturis TaxID=1857645 RepID=UPI00082A2E20|nr:DEAD/DEAH box helicase [Actinomyces vulturis]
MARAPLPTDWPVTVDLAALRHYAGQATFNRGEGLFQAGNVLTVSMAGSGAFLSGKVRSTESGTYDCVIYGAAHEKGMSWNGSCTCPVRSRCKHCVALILAARYMGSHLDDERPVTQAATSWSDGTDEETDNSVAGSAQREGGSTAETFRGTGAGETERSQNTAVSSEQGDLWALMTPTSRIAGTKKQNTAGGRGSAASTTPENTGATSDDTSSTQQAGGPRHATTSPSVNQPRPVVPTINPERNQRRWRERLDRLIPDQDRNPIEVALLFEPPQKPASNRYYVPLTPSWTIRPVTRGKRGWVKTGISWDEIDRGDYMGKLPDEVTHTLMMIASLRRATSGYYDDPRAARLDSLGSGIWSLLKRLQELSIPLVLRPQSKQASSTPEIIIAPSVAPRLHAEHGKNGVITVRADLDRNDLKTVRQAGNMAHSGYLATRDCADAQAVHATLAQAVGDRLERSSIFSTQAHDYVGIPATAITYTSDETTIFAPIVPAPTEELSNLITADKACIEVPPVQHDVFIDDVLPTLSSSRIHVSTDDSIQAPVPMEPKVLCRLTRVEAEVFTMNVSWHVALVTEQGEVRHSDAWAKAVDGQTELPGPYRARIDQLVSAIQAHYRHHPYVNFTDATYDARGAMAVMDQVIPSIATDKQIIVDKVGHIPHFTEFQGTPEILTSVDDSDERDWFSLSVRIALGDEQVPLERLMHALAHGQDVILLDSGTWVGLDQPDVQRLASLMAEARDLADPRHHTEDGSVMISRLQAGFYQDLVEMGVVAQASERWKQGIADLITLSKRANNPADESSDADAAPSLPAHTPLPQDFTATLRPYQHEGYQWLSLLKRTGLGGILADDMGLGKTVQVLAVIQRAIEESVEASGERPAPVLVVAPTSVIGSWVEQAGQFCPSMRVVPLSKTSKTRGTTVAEECAEADVVVTSYAIARIDSDQFTAVDFSWLVVDEGQFVKNYRSATYKAIRSLKAPNALVITGTPLENSLMDLWALASIGAPGLLPSPDRFIEVYRKPIDQGDKKALERLRSRLAPFMLRRTKNDVATDLPPKIEQILSVDLTPAHRHAYEARLSRERQRILGLLDEDSATARFNALRSLMVLRQMALDPTLVDGEEEVGRSAKISVLLDNITPVIGEGHQALVFSQFTSYLTMVKDQLEKAGVSTAYLDGSTSNREAVIEQFRSGQAQVFLISLKAGGFGLTLTQADYVYVLDPWWNPQAEEQAVDRAHRIGQERPVMVYRLVATNTIEDKVMALKAKKADLFNRVVEGTADMTRGASATAALTSEDIRSLVE